MGLFDGVIGDVLTNLGGTGGAQGGNAIMQMVMGVIQQHGGLAGLVETLEKNGLGREVASWVGTGANLPVSAEQISQALGSGPLAALASKFGIDPQQLSGHLAQYLPEAVNHLTPDGTLPANANSSELLESGLSALAGKLFG